MHNISITINENYMSSILIQKAVNDNNSKCDNSAAWTKTKVMTADASL